MSNYKDIAWVKLPFDIRVRAVARLQAQLDPSFFSDVRILAEEKGLGEWLPIGWHFAQGMAIRNLLRSDHEVDPAVIKAAKPIKDDELPPLDEYYGEGTDVRNWDDYYVQCIECAAGLRSLDA
jgi:hypothetical protein